jgi:hypothetical protein
MSPMPAGSPGRVSGVAWGAVRWSWPGSESRAVAMTSGVAVVSSRVNVRSLSQGLLYYAAAMDTAMAASIVAVLKDAT